MVSSIEIEKINNNQIKKILSKNEIEDIENCLISMSEEGTGRHDFSSVISDKKNEIHNNNLLEKVKFNKLNIAKENFKFNNNNNQEINLKKNPNLIFSNNKNFNYNNLKSKNELKNNRPISRKSSKSITNKFKNIDNMNSNMSNNVNFGKNKSSSGKFNHDYVNNNNQNSIYDINNSNMYVNNQAIYDILAALPNKIFIDCDEYNKLKFKPQSEVKIDELVNLL